MQDEPDATSSLATASLASASSLVLLQLLSRVFTFALNQALVRLVSPQVFGTAAIQFELLLSTILFLSREGFRNALLRSPTKGSTTAQNASLTRNIALLPVLLGVPVTLLSAMIYLYSSSATTSSQPHFQLSVIVYALAAFCELLSEPLYIRAQNELRFNVRVKAEGLAVFLKTAVTFVVLVTQPAEWALVAFAAGQAAYGLTMLASFANAYSFQLSYWPQSVKVDVHGNSKTQLFDRSLLQLSGAMTAQSVVKHFLTEGDKFLVSRLSPLSDQGGYAVASNYGSLVARIILQPIEETSRLFLSKMLSASGKNSPEALKSAANALMVLLLIFTHLLILLVTFAPPYLPLALTLVLPSRYLQTSAPSILGTYIYYVPTMAFNGILEAFFTSTATPVDLRAQSRYLLAFSVGFVGAAVAFTQGLGMGDTGLVWANILNLFFRALYAWNFVRAFFQKRDSGDLVHWRKAIPPTKVLVVFAVSALATRWCGTFYEDSPMTIPARLPHIFVGGVFVGCSLLACFIWEATLFRQAYSFIRTR